MGFENYSCEMMGMFDQIHAIGKKLHVWKRQEIPNLNVYKNIPYESWCSFKKQINENYELDPSASFRWVNRNSQFDTQPLECIHSKDGYTFFFLGHEKKVKMIFDYQSTPELKEIFSAKLEALQKRPTNTEIGLLTKMNGRLDVNFFTYRQYEHDLIPYLGKDIHTFRTSMIDHIQSENRNGLYLLYGDPGTGKTSFIKSVLSKVDKQAIFITPSMAEYLASPEMLGLLSHYSGSIIIIEDAEKILMKREGDNSNAVSTILNLSDGFTADFLNLNIICTFNTEIKEIDPALLRKGRLKGMQEFNKLEADNIEKMTDEFGLDLEVTGNMTLAEIWNSQAVIYKQQQKKIGF